MFCSKCGSQMPDDAKFCSACGAASALNESHEEPNTTMDNTQTNNAKEMNKVDLFLAANSKYYPVDCIESIKEKLLTMPSDRFNIIQAIDKKDPVVFLVISLFFGWSGIDRFLLGEIGMGVLKLFTCGCCGVLAVYDWFVIMDKVRRKNYEELMRYL